MANRETETRVATYCALCVSRCGAIATVKGGALRALEPDPSHPTGHALCIKGKVAPELVQHPERLTSPLRRTRPKGDPDPGWEAISWDEALAVTADRLRALARESGPESVAFSAASPSTSAISDSVGWIDRLRHAFGSPNLCGSVELCAWGRYFASAYTYGAGVPGQYLPDLERAGCILFWGYNPTVARLCHATSTVEALGRGARLVVVDPRRAGLAHRADEWLRVRPGTDAALALGLCHVLLERGWFDETFVRKWTNGPLLVRSDDGRFLRGRDLGAADPDGYVAWDEARGEPVLCRPVAGTFEPASGRLALTGRMEVAGARGPIACRPAFDLMVESCRGFEPAAVEAITGIGRDQIERTARLLWEARPLAFYAWSGVEQHADVTQIARAIGQLYALIGSLDAPGGNVLFPAVPSNPIMGAELLPPSQRAKALGLARRPLGPSRFGFVTADDLYTASLDGQPYRVRGLVGFGANLLLAQADGERGRRALQALDFYVHADLFLTPTAELADIVLPVASPFETEALAIGFEVSEAAQSRVQLRQPLCPARGQSRSDIQIVFDLATHLGLGQHFWNGDIEAAWRHQLTPSGLSLEELRARPAGLTVSLETRSRKFAEATAAGVRGFETESRKIELYSEVLLAHGHPPLPVFAQPSRGHAAGDPDGRYPLVLTSAKSTWFCESQHRNLPSLRRRAPEPEVEIHPDTARRRAIGPGDWVNIQTPAGSVRARARFNDALDPKVVCGQHGWWQACGEIGAPGYDPFGPAGANLNRLFRHEPADPVGGCVPHRSSPCDVARSH